jgi:uncharacterized protein
MVNISEIQLLADTEIFVKDIFENEGSGHDWWHIYRVKNLALKIAETEGGNRFIIEMAALLHDIDDWKMNGDMQTLQASLWLKKLNLNKCDAQKILEVIDEVSFKGAGNESRTTSIESKIVQDADRLDAIGAIGIARTFAFGGNKGRQIYNPAIKPEMHNDFESYKKSKAPTINHFYEKLLLLKNRLNTPTAIELAEKRHIFVEQFLEQFFNEWNILD